MALTFGTSNTTVQATGATITITKPAGTAAGSLLVTYLHHDSDVTITTLAGWTLIQRTASGSGEVGLTTFYRVADGAEGASFTWAKTGSSHIYNGACLRYEGEGATPRDGAASSNSATTGTTLTATTVTTTAADETVMVAYASWNDDTLTLGGSQTSRVNFGATGNGSILADFTQASAGATSSRTATADASDSWAAQQFAWQNAAGGSVTVDLSGSPNSVALTTVDPTIVLGSLTLDLAASPNSVALTSVNPSVVLGSLTLDLAGNPAAVALTTVDPTVIQGSVTVDLAAAPNSMALSTVDPTVSAGGDVSLDLSSSPNTLVLTTVDPTVLNPVTLDLTAVPNVLTLTTVNPTVTAGGDITLDLTAAPNTVALSTVDPTVVLGSTTANLIASPNILALTTVNPTVTIADAFALPLTTVTIMTRPNAVSAPRRPVGATTKANAPGAATILV